MDLTPAPTSRLEPEGTPTTRRYHNTDRHMVVDGFTTSLLLVLAAAYLPRLMQGSSPTRAELLIALRMAAIFLGARSERQLQQLSGHAAARFTAYLLATKQAESQACQFCTLRRWLQAHDIAMVTQQLEMAAYAARVLQAAALLDPRELEALVSGRIPEPNSARPGFTTHEDTKA